MLLELAVTDFAIIDELRIEFEPGFNALTGETGAGKSILIDALGAVLGERVGPDAVRTGTKSARVEATFDVRDLSARPHIAETLADLGVEPEDGLLILRREIAASGRSSARINGRAATAGMLARIGMHLVDIHGQSEHLSLLRPAEHLDILDRYAGTLALRREVAALVADLRHVRSSIADIESGVRERAQRIDLLRFQVDEIEAADLRPGEEEELTAERAVLSNAERLALDANATYVLLAGDEDAVDSVSAPPAVMALRQASGHLDDISAVDETMQPMANRLEELVFLLEDIASETRAYRDRIEADPARLAAVEDRLDLLSQLKRKYGATVEEVIDFGKRAARELEDLTGGDVSMEALMAREQQLAQDVGQQACLLSRQRQAAGETFARAVEATIAELNMGRTSFVVSIEQVSAPDGVPFRASNDEELNVACDATGADRIEFLIAPNAGEALKPLGRVASGGETARLMLALKSILSAADATPTLVFDEVDVGVGGRSGQVVGEKLWGLAGDHQILVITHLPQIAAFATTHFRIQKGERDRRVTSNVERVEDADRLDELAAMLNGFPVTDASRANAREMLERIAEWKASASDRRPVADAATVRS